MIVRIFYLLSIGATIGLVWASSSFLFAIFQPGSPMFIMSLPALVAAAAAFVGIVIAFALTAARLYWWGKMVCLIVGGSWLTNALGLYAMEIEAPWFVSGIAGAIIMTTAIVHFIVDPRITPPPRQS